MLEYFSIFFENTRGPFFLLSEEGEVVELNRAALKFLDREKRKIVDQSLEQFCPHQVEEFLRYMKICLRNSRPMPGSLTFEGLQSTIPCKTWGYSLRKEEGDSSTRNYILLQCEPKESPQNRFIALNKKLKELQKSHRQLAHHSGLLEREIEERKNYQKGLEKWEQLFQKAQKLAHIGSWQLDFSNGELEWSEETYQIFGLPLDQSPSYRDFLNYVYPEDRPFVEEAWRGAAEGKKYDIEHRILLGDQIKWVREKAEIERD